MYQIQRDCVGQDMIHYGTACADNIPDLKFFQGSCKPLFLLMAQGGVVGFVQGADGARMRGVMQEQVEKELQVLHGDALREHINIEEAIHVNNDGSGGELDDDN